MKIRIAYQMIQTYLYTDKVFFIENTKISLNMPSVYHHIHHVWKPLCLGVK